MSDYYKTLSVEKGASKEEIKKAYKKLAKKFHPDISKEPDAEAKFKEVSEAYAVLGDEKKKAQYDQFGDAAFHQRYSQEDIFRNFDFSDIGNMFGGDIFDMFFGGGRSRQRRGRDLRYDLDITFEDAAFGVEKELELYKMSSCPDCGGSGAKDKGLVNCSACDGSGQMKVTRRTPFGVFAQVAVCSDCRGLGQSPKETCTACKGAGRKKVENTLKVKIPAGVADGSQLRVSGAGEAGERGSHPGDLYVMITVEPSEIFQREGNDILLDLPITFSQAALGDTVKVPTLEKDVTLKIPSGTQTGTKFRLAGKGFPYINGLGKGDQFVVANVMTPKRVSKDQKKLFQDLKKTEEKKSVFEKIKEFAKI